MKNVSYHHLTGLPVLLPPSGVVYQEGDGVRLVEDDVDLVAVLPAGTCGKFLHYTRHGFAVIETDRHPWLVKADNLESVFTSRQKGKPSPVAKAGDVAKSYDKVLRRAEGAGE